MEQPIPELITLTAFLDWEQQQTQRHEWIDGTVVPCAGVSADHSTISANMLAIFHAALGNGPCIVQTPDRQLVPRDKQHYDLGSFYADLFVSCDERDRIGTAAHFPKVVVEILSTHVGEEFTRKKRAYLGSAHLVDYVIVDSRDRYIYRYSWKTDAATGQRRLVVCEQRRGPLVIPSLGLVIDFDQLYANTKVPVILHPLVLDEDSEILITLE